MERSRLPLILIVIILALCVTVACIAAAGGVLLYRVLGAPQRAVGLELPTVSQPLVETEILIPAVNRLIVLGDDGNLYTVRPDGAERIDLTTDADESHVYRQPAWSPDGERIAWVESVASVASATLDETSLRTSRIDGSEPTRADMGDFAPFYLSWSPDSSNLACLSNWAEGLALRTVDMTAGGDEARLIGNGRPLYFSWSPDGQQVLAHLSGERLSLLSLGGGEERLDAQPGVFGAPDWSTDGKHLVFVERQGANQRLVWAARDGSVENELAQAEGSLTFSLSRDGERVAYVDTTVEVMTAAFGPLAVVNTETGERIEVADAPVLAFFWSPDNRKLAYLVLAEDPDNGPRASSARGVTQSHAGLWLQWHIWDGNASYELARFAPADTFLVEHLRFFDQYARSMTPWSPDSAALTFAGQTEDGALGVWVQAATPEGRLDRAGDGVYAAWSPR